MSSINIDVRRPLSSYTAVCRVCMKENTNDNSNKFHDIYIDKINSVDIHELLVTMLKIVIDPEDLRPKLICGECYNKITEWHNMIFQAQLSQFCVDQIFSRKKVNIDDHTQQAITSSTSAIGASNNENKDNSNNNPSTSSASFISAPNNDDENNSNNNPSTSSASFISAPNNDDENNSNNNPSTSSASFISAPNNDDENYSNNNSSTPSTYVFSASDDDDDDKDPSAYVINVSDDDDNDYLNNSPSTSPAYVISASDDDNDKDPSTPSAYVISASDDDNDKDPSTPSAHVINVSDDDDNDYSNNNPPNSSISIISSSDNDDNDYSNNNPSTSSAPIISASRDKNNSNKNPTSNLAHNTDDDTAKIFYLMPSTSADGTHTHVINDKIDVGQREHYSCIIPSCRSFYRTFKGFKIHYRRHRKVVNSVVCWKCNNTFPNMSVMRSHQFNRSCMFPGMFTCALCPKKFDDLESLSIHKYVEHVNNQPKWLCLKVFNS